MSRRVRGFASTVLAMGAVTLAVGASMAFGLLPDPGEDGRAFWGVLVVAGLLQLFVGTWYLPQRARLDAEMRVGAVLFQTTWLTVGAATLELSLVAVHAAGRFLGFRPEIMGISGDPILRLGLTTIVLFFAALALAAWAWTRHRGTKRRTSDATSKHVLAVGLALLPWAIPAGFIA